MNSNFTGSSMMRGKSKYSLVKVDLISYFNNSWVFKMFARSFRAQILLLVFSSGFSPSQIVLPHESTGAWECEAWLARPCTILNPLGLKASLRIWWKVCTPALGKCLYIQIWGFTDSPEVYLELQLKNLWFRRSLGTRTFSFNLPTSCCVGVLPGNAVTPGLAGKQPPVAVFCQVRDGNCSICSSGWSNSANAEKNWTNQKLWVSSLPATC